jgi:hypothetical protein
MGPVSGSRSASLGKLCHSLVLYTRRYLDKATGLFIALLSSLWYITGSSIPLIGSELDIHRSPRWIYWLNRLPT